MDREKEIEKARRNLRKLYIKYTDELFDVINKIDKFLEGLQDGD